MNKSQQATPWLFLIALTAILTTASQAADEKKAPPKSEQLESTLLNNVRQLTFEGKRSGEGYFGADGTSMIFQSERVADNPFFQIYTMDLENGDVEPVSPGHGKPPAPGFIPRVEKPFMLPLRTTRMRRKNNWRKLSFAKAASKNVIPGITTKPTKFRNMISVAKNTVT